MVTNRRRQLSFSVLVVLAASVVLGSISWACTGPDFGTPAQPAPPSSPGQAAPPEDPSTATPAPTPPPATANAPAPPTEAPSSSAPSTSQGTPTTSVDGSSGAASAPGESNSGANAGLQRTRGDAGAVAGGGATAGGSFAARESGATEGVTNVRGEAVFASSTPKTAKGKAAARSRAGALSDRSAVRDPWAGFGSAASASDDAGTAASSEAQGGSKLAMGILALGLIGAAGTLLVAVPRRRRAEAQSKIRGDAHGR